MRFSVAHLPYKKASKIAVLCIYFAEKSQITLKYQILNMKILLRYLLWNWKCKVWAICLYRTKLSKCKLYHQISQKSK